MKDRTDGVRDTGGNLKRDDRPISREEFSEFCGLLYERDLVRGAGGNLSARVGERILMTPSGYSLRDVAPGGIVTIDMDGNVLHGETPTKDVEMHLGILRVRADIDVVCHVHGSFIIAATTLLEPGSNALPPLTPGFVYFARPMAMIPFMVPGSEKLAAAVKDHFSDTECSALLLQNHGLVTVGKGLQEALNIAEEIDEAARIWLLTEGRAKVISEEDVRRIKRL